MKDSLLTLVATCPEDDVCARFRAEILKLAALYGVQVTSLTVGDRPSLTVLEGGGGNHPGAA